jgi:uncharacterized membrane protein
MKQRRYGCREGDVMTYCSKCGAPLKGRFCASCGTEARGGAGDGQRRTRAEGERADQPLERNVASTLCYALGFITGLLFLWLAPYKYDAAVRFHGYQSILFSAVLFVLHAAVTIAALLFSLLSLELGVLVSSLHAVVSAVFFVAWLFLMWKSFQRQKVVLPVIGPMAQQLAGEDEPGAPSSTMGKAA